MRCGRCGAEVTAGKAFCTKCGQPVSAPAPTVQPPATQASNRRWPIVVAIGSAVLLVVAIVLALQARGGDPTTPLATAAATADVPSDEPDEPDETIEPPFENLVAFRSPSGNIGCYVTEDEARCDISEREWESPPQPSSCELDFGQGMFVQADGTSDFVCAGDTALNPEGSALAYGDHVRVGDIRCDSNEDGMSCYSLRNNHGFTISRDDYSFF